MPLIHSKQLLATAVLVLSAVIMSGQPQKAPDTRQPAPAAKDQPPVPSVHNDDTSEHISTANPDSPKWYAPFKRPEWWLVGVGLVTLGIIGWQAIETRRAAQAMRDSLPFQERAATAAKENTDAQINAERAWVIPEFLPFARIGTDRRWHTKDRALTTEEILRGEHLRCFVKLTNMGSTPAQVISIQVNYTCLPQQSVSELPANTQGQLIHMYPFNHFLAGKEAIEIFDPSIDVHASITQSAESFGRIQDHRATAIFYGWVQYRHMFSDKESCFADFCYVYTPELKRLTSAGPYPKQRQEPSDRHASAHAPDFSPDPDTDASKGN